MVTWRRVTLVIVLLIVAAIAYTAWLAWRVEHELRDAQDAVSTLRTSLDSGDTAARQSAIDQLHDSADAAEGHTDGFWWGGLEHIPVVGDDARGVEALSSSVQTVANGAADPLVAASDDLDKLTSNGNVNLSVLKQLRAPVASAHEALDQAAATVAASDSSHFFSALQTRYDDYAQAIDSLDRGLGAADTGLQVAPQMLGDDGPRTYLLVFQNNAEIRATGGVPGSWALLRANDGNLRLVRQGSDADFPVYSENKPVTTVSAAERKVYGPEIARYFQDPGFTPDFQRSAPIFHAFWDKTFPDDPIDGVVSLDPVALSYVLRGLQPVSVGDQTITADNAVQELLNQVYIDNPNPKAQDAFFQSATKGIFDSFKSGVTSPQLFVEGLARATTEGRIQLSAFDSADERTLAGTRITHPLTGDAGSTPHVDVGFNDATGSKMSYYLRYDTQVQSMSCTDDTQSLAGSMRLTQTIDPAEAKTLPDYITGGGDFGTDVGDQTVIVRIYAPWQGDISGVTIDGKSVKTPQVDELDGRKVLTLAITIDSTDDTTINWNMTTGPGQTGATALDMTPSVVPGDQRRTFPSSC